MSLFYTLSTFLHIYRWQDIFEIAVLSWACYTIISILYTHPQKSFIKKTMLYCSIAIVSYLYDCTSLQIFFLIAAPAGLTLWTLIHQELIQQKITPTFLPAYQKPLTTAWHPTLIQFLQRQASKNIATSCIILKTDSIDSSTASYISCSMTLTPTLLEILYESPTFFTDQFVVFNYDGTISGINLIFKGHSVLHHNVSQKELELYITAKTDAMIIKTDPQTITFTCIHNNQTLSHLSAHALSLLLNKFFEFSSHPMEGSHNGIIHQKKDLSKTVS